VPAGLLNLYGRLRWALEGKGLRPLWRKHAFDVVSAYWTWTTLLSFPPVRSRISIRFVLPAVSEPLTGSLLLNRTQPCNFGAAGPIARVRY
jgi:hypothetical protein